MIRLVFPHSLLRLSSCICGLVAVLFALMIWWMEIRVGSRSIPILSMATASISLAEVKLCIIVFLG